jgi:hypothetical protein
MEPLKALEVKRVEHSEDLLHPGEFVFVAKRQPKITTETIAVEPPQGTFKKLLWTFFGAKHTVKQTIEPVWPDYDAVILMCPHCNQPIGTTKEHHVVSTEPLTIDQPLACAYSRPSPRALPTIAFQIKDGKIMPA